MKKKHLNPKLWLLHSTESNFPLILNVKRCAAMFQFESHLKLCETPQRCNTMLQWVDPSRLKTYFVESYLQCIYIKILNNTILIVKKLSYNTGLLFSDDGNSIKNLTSVYLQCEPLTRKYQVHNWPYIFLFRWFYLHFTSNFQKTEILVTCQLKMAAC